MVDRHDSVVRAMTAAAAAQKLEAWVTPPAYTGAAPVFLNPAGGAAAVPAGSRLQVAVSGGSGAPPVLSTDAGDTPFRALDGGAGFLAETALESGGRLAVRREDRTLAVWTLTAQADAPPFLALVTVQPAKSLPLNRAVKPSGGPALAAGAAAAPAACPPPSRRRAWRAAGG